jgi:DNA-binding transcriptional MerR regulator
MSEDRQGPNRSIQIGKAAERVGLSIDTIRFYERQALLPKAPRTAGHFRLYAAQDVARLTFIKQMQTLGFSLQEIKQLLDLREQRNPCREVRDLMDAKLAEVRNKIRELQELEHALEVDLRRCNRELRHGQNEGPKQCPVLSCHARPERRGPYAGRNSVRARMS